MLDPDYTGWAPALSSSGTSMKAGRRGRGTSVVEVTNISSHGFWILIRGRELFLPFASFPWFEKATVAQIFAVSMGGPGHLYWPELDVDLAVRSIEDPDAFPLVSGVTKTPPKRARGVARPVKQSGSSRSRRT